MVSNNTIKKTSIKTLFVLLVAILFCFVCLGLYLPTNMVRAGQIVGIVLFFAIMCFTMLKPISSRKVALGIIGYYSMILLYWAIGYSTASSGNYLFQICFFISIIIAIYCIRRLPLWHNHVLYYFILLLTIVHLTNDIVIGQVFQSYSMEELEELGSSVIATSFSTTALLVLNIALLVALNTSNFYIRLIHFVVVAITLYYIVFCGQRGSVVMLMMISVFAIIYQKRANKVSKGTSLFFLLLIALIIMLFGEYLLSILIELSPSERLAERFEDLQQTFRKGVTEDSFSGRLSLEIVSIRSWLRNIATFFIGIGDHRLEGDFGIVGFELSGIGGHSELIDSLARYGIIGFFIIASLFSRIFKYIINLFDDVSVREQVKAILFVSILISLTKGFFFPEIGISLFLLLPLSSLLLNKYKLLK